jgi:23S rRNA-/tRNA-specific pseudouridylate synthase
MDSFRLPVLFESDACLAIAKPQGILVQADSWYPRLPVMVEAIRHQAGMQKPEFQRLGIGPEGLWAIHDLDPELYGPVLFARNREQGDELRSACGSSVFEFTFTFLTKGSGHLTGQDSHECDLPIARHRSRPMILVSHTTGKKAHTQFDRVGSVGRFQIWTARMTFPRRHQVFLHAFECGLPVLGDRNYARESALLLSRFKRNYRVKQDVEERPLYGGPACFLSSIRVSDSLHVQCQEPPRWKGLLNQLERHSSS